MNVRLALASAAALGLMTGSAFAVSVKEKTKINAPAEKVWEASAADFCGIGQFHPAVEKCELSNGGTTRTLSLKGGGTIVENQTAMSKGSYSYEIVESPLPVENYKSTFTVKGKGETSTVTWKGSFKAKGASDAEAKKAIDGIYTSGLEALKAKF